MQYGNLFFIHLIFNVLQRICFEHLFLSRNCILSFGSASFPNLIEQFASQYLKEIMRKLEYDLLRLKN